MDRDLSRSRAVLISNSVYADPKISDLPAAASSLDAMGRLLTGDLCGWPPDRVVSLPDLASPSEVARRLIPMVRDVTDTVLLYYVGHGLRTSDGQLALALADSEADPESLPHTAILYDALARILRGSPAATKVVILDCCHAELGTRANFQFQSSDFAETYPVDGLYFMGASRMHAKAKAPLGNEPTYFTEAFLNVVAGGIPHKPAELRLDQIFVELRARLLRAGLPEPVESGTSGARRFLFARNAAPTTTHLDPDAEIRRLTAELAAKSARTLGSAVAQESWNIVDYLHDLIRSGSRLTFGDPAAQPDTGDEAGLITLEQIWTPLRVADSRAAPDLDPLAASTEGVDLGELLDATEDSVVILGDPGGGKSTSIAAIAVRAARRYLSSPENPLPIRVQLGSVIAALAGGPELLLLSGVPEVKLTIARDGRNAGNQLTEFLRAEIQQGRALLLLDGIDEIAEASLGAIRRAISHILLPANGTRIIATCRKFDYRQTRPSRKVGIPRELELLPYTRTDKNQYVQQWYDAAARTGRFSTEEAVALASSLKRELLNPELAELGELPLLLTLLTLIHSDEGQLPDIRAVVCDRAIRYLLADKARWRGQTGDETAVPVGSVLALAIRVAHHIHLGEESTRGASASGVTREKIHVQAAALCADLARLHVRSSTPDPHELTSRLLRSHGLLVEIGPGRYRFAHRYFQEFLAGQHYAQGARTADVLAKARMLHWREPLRLMASFAGYEGENIFYILTLVSELLGREEPAHDGASPNASSAASSVTTSQLAAEMLVEIGQSRLAAFGFDRVLSPDTDSHGIDGLWQRAKDAITEQVEDARLPLAERFRAASVVGHLGDRRVATESGRPRGPWENLVPIPAGPALMGSGRLDDDRTISAGTRLVDFPAFGIGRYLVTNAQYAAFVEADGYADRDYWRGRMATGWISGDPAVLSDLRAHWLRTVHEHHAKELRDGEILITDLRAESVVRIGTRTRPFYWDDRRFNQPNQPVVGINYWEAEAYCAWATEQGRRTGMLGPAQLVSLPTEFEWERACRPVDDDRVYPWGDEESDDRTHLRTNALNIRQPSPVGIYLPSWEEGPCDLGGNVWEWTTSLNRPYGPEHDTERSAYDSLDEHIVRGSSWYNTFRFAACSSRAVDRSYNLFYDVGFRVVVVDASAHRPGEAASGGPAHSRRSHG
ncbi:SUMF1/EgtB/PvdO family nonheme iron enzyme [Streptomyces phyllanthi]|uniref:SUMF1/EgtB/PvdOfamily nonheme iron enzyme n=1 Tax=Streptomyces phyllanthi TaxID=1803180 RepID=A0A5N8W3V6_9ACTN|nr:SUMF1/EgtB/PvdO family nonheme iron enzyme [Streptomyces phyllanthi]MPY41792.1 SUMF1/EgtB/PvdOfamily nonheme iron enzyme [Streptomyces phyllanthi]